jgi:hypothetical protein
MIRSMMGVPKTDEGGQVSVDLPADAARSARLSALAPHHFLQLFGVSSTLHMDL